MFLGAAGIIIVGILIINYFSKQDKGELVPSLNVEKASLPTTHKVGEGEDLWGISEKYYRTGYNWVDIAKENNLSDPNEIKIGQELKIPDVKPKLTEITQNISPSLVPTDAPETEEKSATTGKKEHIVSKGENLWKIAEKYFQSGYKWVDIAQENSIAKPYILEVGQKLSIPDISASKQTVEKETKKSEDSQRTSISGATYTVEKGDSLWTIALRACADGYKWGDIAKENKLSNPNLIHPGNKLSLPR